MNDFFFILLTNTEYYKVNLNVFKKKRSSLFTWKTLFHSKIWFFWSTPRYGRDADIVWKTCVFNHIIIFRSHGFRKYVKEEKKLYQIVIISYCIVRKVRNTVDYITSLDFVLSHRCDDEICPLSLFLISTLTQAYILLQTGELCLFTFSEVFFHISEYTVNS